MNLEVLHVGPLGTNCYIVWDEDKCCAVVDCGGEGQKVAQFLKEKGLTPSHLLLTHGHGDHIGGVERFLDCYPQVKVVLGREDLELVSDRVKSMAETCGCEESVFEPDIFPEEGDVIPVGKMAFRVMKTPGHTPGGLTYVKDNLLFTGDTLFQGSMGRTDLYGGDEAAMMASLRRFGDFEGYNIVLPGHGPASNLEDELRSNPFLRQALK